MDPRPGYRCRSQLDECSGSGIAKFLNMQATRGLLIWDRRTSPKQQRAQIGLSYHKREHGSSGSEIIPR